MEEDMYKLKDDGRFEVKAKGLDLGDPGAPVPFSLLIGNDIGEAEIPLD